MRLEIASRNGCGERWNEVEREVEGVGVRVVRVVGSGVRVCVVQQEV